MEKIRLIYPDKSILWVGLSNKKHKDGYIYCGLSDLFISTKYILCAKSKKKYAEDYDIPEDEKIQSEYIKNLISGVK